MGTKAEDLAHERSFKLGHSVVEPARRLIRGPGKTALKVEPRVMQVLVALADAKGGLLSRKDLRDSCWQGRLTSDDAVDRVIAQIRRLGAAAGGSFTVETVSKVGYRLVGQLSGAEPENLSAYSRRSILGAGVSATAAAAAAIMGGVALYRSRGRAKRQGSDHPFTIAVLPFTAETPSLELTAFAAALADDVRSDVSRVSDIRVIAQTSSRKVAAENLNPRQIGESLAADYLIEGQVGSTGGQVVAGVAVVDTADGAQLWTRQESASLRDRAALRAAISGDVIQQLAGIIPISAHPSPPVRRPDPRAYALIQQANDLLEQARTETMRDRRQDGLQLGARAERLTNQALSIDPSDSGALTVLAALTRNGWTPALAERNLTTEQRVQASISIVRRALLADPRNPAALTELGDYYRRFAFRWTEAENLFRRALSIDPSFVDAHWSYGYELATLGRVIEGLDHALSVFELDPRNPFRRIALPRLLYLVGARSAALRRYDVELQEQPDNIFLLRELYFLLLSERSAPDLQRLGARIDALWRGRRRTAGLSALRTRVDAGRLALTGKPEPLRAMVEAEVSAFDRSDAVSDATPQGRARDDLPFIFAIEYAAAGVPQRALDMLDRALAAKSLYWPATLPFGVAQFPPEVRNSARFAALWERDPGLHSLLESRRSAIMSGQMAGFTPAGRKVVPILPTSLVRRVQSALRAQA